MAFFKKGVVSRNKKSTEVAYIRHGRDFVNRLGSDESRPKRYPTVWVTTKDGQKWEIPVDPKTGKVPMDCLYGHFLDVHSGSKDGKKRSIGMDIGVDADTLHEIPEGGFTPRQLIETGWWQAVNGSDIIGVDDTGALELAKELEGASKSAAGSGRRMIFRMSPESADKARAILAKDFTGGELRRAVMDGGLIIKEGNPGRGNSGCYVAVQESSSIKTPMIILREGWDEETLVHEFTHHLRFVDNTREGLTRTAHKVNDKGEWSPLPKKEENSARNLEEAATVTESLVRIQEPSKYANGYFGNTKAYGETPYERYTHDRNLLVPEKPYRGRRAEKRVKDKFNDTSISQMKRYKPGYKATDYFSMREIEGTMPKAKKPAKKKPVKSANKMYTRAKR